MIGTLAMHVGWRNLWRNPRRTWLTSGGVAFAVFLVVLSMCIQLGSYEAMESNATSLLSGQIQVQNADYPDSNRLRDTVQQASAVVAALSAVPGVTGVSARLEAFALASAGERSFGAQVLGIDPQAEARVVHFAERISQGRQLAGADEAVLGDGLARNLGVGLNDQLVVLGTGKDGGVAAMVVTVVGLFNSGISDLDRALLLVSLDSMREVFGFGDEAHSIVLASNSPRAVQPLLAPLRSSLNQPGFAGQALVIRPWWLLLPELRQAIEIDRISGQFFYWLIMVLVAFSAVNTFIMTVFERTREFGMLLAIGMAPWRILGVLQWEAFFLWLLGAAVGLALASALVWWLADVGIYMGAAVEEMSRQMYMPGRIHPTFVTEALITAPLVMLLGTQLAALVPAWRIRRLQPAAALRAGA